MSPVTLSVRPRAGGAEADFEALHAYNIYNISLRSHADNFGGTVTFLSRNFLFFFSHFIFYVFHLVTAEKLNGFHKSGSSRYLTVSTITKNERNHHQKSYFL
jgi:short subunit fatty acids transporter